LLGDFVPPSIRWMNFRANPHYHMMRIKRLAPQTFDHVADTTRLGAQAREMARAVLVDGRAQADVAVEYGMTKQRVNLAVAVIKRAYVTFAEPGESFIRCELDLPEALALELSELAEALAQCPDAERREAITEKVLVAVRNGRKRLACLMV
jgi:hypothetical protein